jgi:hypothetical protein
VLAFLLYRVVCGLLGLLVRVGLDDRDLEIAVLRQLLRILRRRGRRPRYSTADRAVLAAASRFLPRERWSAFPVAPDTLNRWRRHLRSRKRLSRRRGPGRPPIDRAVRELILRMARENPRWGYLRIKGELLKLGITVSATTIANVLRRSGLGPAPRRIGPTWSQFLRAQALAILSIGAPVTSPEEGRGGQEQAPTLPARDAAGRPSLEEESCPREAPAVRNRVPERGWEQRRVLRLNRPSRTPVAHPSLLSGANPRDGPVPTQPRLVVWPDQKNPTGSPRPWGMNRGAASSQGPSERTANVRWL